MMPKKATEKWGRFLISTSLVIWIVDLLTNIFSTLIGKIICGDQYMCPVDGVVCDKSCGFNTDMHLAFVLVIFMVLGIVLLISSKRGVFPIDIKNGEAKG